MSPTVRIGVAGAGLIGRRHLSIIDAAAGDTALMAIADPDPSSAATADAHGVPHFQTVAEMLASEKPDGIVLATPNRYHLEDALLCIKAGVPVLVEKPLATTADEGRKIVEASKDTGVPVLTGHHRRYNPIIQKARELIAGGAIGKIVSVHASFWLYKPDDYFDTTWRREQGGGPVYINLIHDIDLLQYLCGPVETVMALESNATRNFDVEDSAALTVRFANGALGTVNLSDSIVAPWSWEMTAKENPAYPATDQSAYWIGGTRGSLELPGLRLWHQGKNRSWMEPIERKHLPLQSGDPLVEQIRHFAAVIRGHEKPLVNALDGFLALQAVEAVKRSAASGQPVHLSPSEATDE